MADAGIPSDARRRPRAWLRASARVPGVALIRNYRKEFLRYDIVAGLVLTSLLVPQGMAYAELAGVPAVNGLYATIACLVGYALMGPSRILVLGPDSAVSPMILASITAVGAMAATDGKQNAIELAGMLAIMVGALEIALGIARLGFVADLLSKEVKVGYLNGLAMVIIFGQLPKLFGFSVKGEHALPKLKEFFTNLDRTNGPTLIIGTASLVALFALTRFAKALPAVLVVIVATTLVSHLLHLSDHGVSTVGPLPEGLPRPAVPWTSLGDVGQLALAAVGITLVSLTDTIATSASFAARHGETVSANREMVGVGVANTFAGLFQGFAVSSSASRTAVADSSKAKTQLAGVVGASGVVVLLLFANSILAALPQSVLAAVVIAAAVSLADLGSIRRYWKVRRSAVLVSAVSTGGVVLFGVLEGIALAIGLSVLMFFRRNWWPHGVVLGRGTGGAWHALGGDEEVTRLPGIAVFRWEAPLFFANSGIFSKQVSSLAGQDGTQWIVLQCEAITDIDVTAADMLRQLDMELNAVDVHIAFVELRTRLQRQLAKYGLFEEALATEHFYDSINAAISHITVRHHQTSSPV